MNIDMWAFEDLISAVTHFRNQQDAINQNWQDMSKKDSIACVKINENPTRINFKKITIKIPTFSKEKGGFFSSDFAQF